MKDLCEAVVELGDSQFPLKAPCGAPLPRDYCPFAERVVSGRCASGVSVVEPETR